MALTHRLATPADVPALRRVMDAAINELQLNRQGASRPGVMGDGTQEQNLNQPGDPKARITRQEVEAAFR
jgi:hypothetical protein